MSNLSTHAAQTARRYSIAPRYPRPGAIVVASAVLLSLLALLPLGFVIGVAFETGWQTVKALVFRPRVAELLLNTLLLVVLTLPICAVLGVALAWLTERTTLPGRRLWAVLATAPLAVPAFVQSYAWISLVPSMHGLSAGVIISVLAYFPFIYLPAAAVLRRLDPGIEDVATSLGSRPPAVFFRVVLPQLKLAVWGVVADRIAPAGGVWPVCHDPLRYLHHRDLRSVPVDLQRPGGQHAGRRIGAVLPRAAVA